MSILNIFRTKDINRGIEEYKTVKGAVLLDVRTPGEYAEGHIENSVNIPLQSIAEAEKIIASKTVPIFVYCMSGARSSQAAGILKRMGYTDVNDIGGILSYKGAIVRE